MRVLVACEHSGVVRDAFLATGADAISCDLMPTEAPGPHWQGDVLEILDLGWDLMIAHPPCTYLATAARHSPEREQAREQALAFVAALMAAPIPSIAIENPISVLATRVGAPAQVIQPWQFGHTELKTTCLWLKGLWPLMPTQVMEERRKNRNGHGPPGPRWKRRSRTYAGIAAAMADQWREGADRPEGWLV